MSLDHILARLELVAQQYPNAKHRQLRNVIRETIVHVTKMKPELERPKVEYAGAGRLIVDYLNENGPKLYAEIRDGLPHIPNRTIQAAIRTGVQTGKINATQSRTKHGKIRASRTYSSAEWDAGATRMRADFASSWMRNPVILEETAHVQD
jgi:hypothetical protein